MNVGALVGAFAAGLAACVGGVTILNSAELVGSEAATYAWLLILSGAVSIIWSSTKWWSERSSS